MIDTIRINLEPKLSMPIAVHFETVGLFHVLSLSLCVCYLPISPMYLTAGHFSVFSVVKINNISHGLQCFLLSTDLWDVYSTFVCRFLVDFTQKY